MTDNEREAQIHRHVAPYSEDGNDLRFMDRRLRETRRDLQVCMADRDSFARERDEARAKVSELAVKLNIALSDGKLGTPTQTELYEALKHGDEEHRAWLREAIAAVFDGDPVPLPRDKKTAPPEANVMERARDIARGVEFHLMRNDSEDNQYAESAPLIAYALTEYGDQRAHDAHMVAYREGLQRLSDERKMNNWRAREAGTEAVLPARPR